MSTKLSEISHEFLNPKTGMDQEKSDFVKYFSNYNLHPILFISGVRYVVGQCAVIIVRAQPRIRLNVH